MKRIRKRVFAAVLAALMLAASMPETALYASAETESVSGNATGQAGTEDTEETETDNTGETEVDGSTDKQETGDADTNLSVEKSSAALPDKAAAEGTPDLELFGQEVCSGDSGEGWSYADGVLTLENYHVDNSDKCFIHVTNADLEFTIYLKGDNSVKTSETLIWGSVFGNMTITGEQGASLSMDGKKWSDRYIFIRGVNVDVTTQEMIFLAYDMVIDNATVNINMNGSSGYIYTTHGSFTVQNGSDVTITNPSGEADYCVVTNKAEITDSTLNITNSSGFGVYVTKLSSQVSEFKTSVTNSTVSADVLDAAIHCEEEVSVANSQVTGGGRFLIRSKKTIAVDDSSTLEGITYEFFKSDTGAAYRVHGDHTLAAGLTVAENGSFVIPEGAALTIPGGVTLENNGTMRIHDKASLTGTGVLTGSGDFLIDVSEDMISIPEGLVYTGTDYTDQIILEESAVICGVEFTADTEGWTRSIEPAVVKDAGDYTVTFTNGDRTISKTFTVAKSDTDLKTEGKVLTYNGDTQTTTFNADDTITVKAAPTATGTAPQKAAARLRGAYTTPTAGQMALFVDDVQVSEPVGAGADGIYTMTVNASKVLLHGNAEQNGNAITLTAKFIGNDNMADAAGTVDVNITAVAMAEKGDTVIGYYGESNLADAFAEDSGNDGATITLLDNITTSKQINVYTDNLTLDLNGKTYTCTQNDFQIFYVSLTIKGSGAITTSGYYCLAMDGGTLNIESGSFSAKDSAVYVESGGTLQLTGGSFTGNQNAIAFNSGEVTAALANYGGADAPHYAFYQGSSPYAPSGRSLPKGTFTVQECQHNGVTPTSNQNGTHALKCPYCGYSEDAVDCAYVFGGTTGTCATCGDSVTVAVFGAENLIYDGTGKEPEVTVTRDGTELTAGTDYTVKYENNTNAGTATVAVTIGDGQGTYSEDFDIAQAMPTVAWGGTSQELTYTGSPAAVTEPMVTLVNGEDFGGTISYFYRKQGETAYKAGLPADVGTYTIKARVGAEGNYTAADSTNELTLMISYMDAPVLLYDNSGEKKAYYSGDVAVTAAPADGHTYTVCDAIGGEYKEVFTIPARQGTVTKTLYFQDEAGHISDGVEVTVRFDLTPPVGKIGIGAKWWQSFLKAVSFGHYKVKEHTVTIEAQDKGGSGAVRIEYMIAEDGVTYADADELAKAGVDWKEYKSGSKPTVPADKESVVYAKLTDGAGNVTYIGTEGILLDSTAPTVDDLTVPEDAIEDVTAGVAFTVDEAADYYYVVLPKDSAAPSAENIIVTCKGMLPEGKTGTAIAGAAASGKGAVSGDTFPAGVTAEVKNLSPNTGYFVYVTAVDRALDITDSAKGTPAGNIAGVGKAEFTTKKTLPVVAKVPTAAGIYGQSVGEMTVAGGVVKAGSTVLSGVWTVSDTDKDRKPDAGTAEKVSVVFTPDDDKYESVSAEASLKVDPRNLDAPGVTVSEAAGTYTYDNGAEIKPAVTVNGASASGISVSDSEAILTADDLTVSYSNNKNAGTASVTITGKGNYTGSVTREFTIEKAPGRTIPNLTGSYTDNGQTYIYTIKSTAGAVYRMGDDGEWTASGAASGNVFAGITPGTRVTFYAKMPETENYKEGIAKSITVNFPKITPAAPVLSYTRETDKATGKIALTIAEVKGAEYSFDGGVSWQDAWKKDGFDASQTVTLAIRLKATNTHNQSPKQAVTVTLNKADQKAPSAFSLKVAANGETDYTVTIPPAEGCEYSFDGETWSESNVKTGVKAGENVTGYVRYKETDEYNASGAASAKAAMPKFTVKTPAISPAGGSYFGSISVTITCGTPDAEIYYTTDGSAPGRGSTRYTGEFTVSTPARVRAVAIKDGMNDSAVAAVSYTKPGGGSGSGSGGSKDSGGSGNTTPVIPAAPPTTGTNPGTKPAKSGTGNTERPGAGMRPGSGGTDGTGPGIPFIKDEDGKIGWDVIRAEEEQAEEGSVINVDMNGTTVVPGDIFDSIKGKDITITFDMGEGILWSVDGKSIVTDKADGIDFSVKTGGNSIPVDIVNNVTRERYGIQLSLSYEGEFGFTAVLFVNLGEENEGYTANLYYYNESTGKLEFICADEIAEDGTVSLAFTHASDYVLVIDGERGSGDAAKPARPEEQDGASAGAAENPQAGQARNLWRLAAVGALAAAIGIAVFFAVRKKKEDDE